MMAKRVALCVSAAAAAVVVVLAVLCCTVAAYDNFNADAQCFLKNSGFDSVSVKDPSIVYANNRWHLFYTGKDSCCFRMGYATATSIAGLRSAPHQFLQSALRGGDWFCAPQVFYFSAKNTWYLVYQSQGATFSTNTDINNPNGWTAGKAMGFGDGIDFWVVVDAEGQNVYAFYSKQDQTILTRHTTVAAFPYGWSAPSVAVRDAFEAVHVYHSKADGKYYMMVEHLYRWFELHVADTLAGPFRLVDYHWADASHVTYNPGVTPWVGQVSHGEIIRASNNEYMEINDIHRVDILIQSNLGGNYAYGDIPYSLGLIHNFASNPNPTYGGGSSGGGTCALTSKEGENVTLSCAYADQFIKSVDFASYGTPTGDCSAAAGFTKSTCDANNTLSFVQSKCVRQSSCSFTASNDVFGDPCSGVQKKLAVKVSCASPTCVITSSENESVTLSCPAADQLIKTVDFASYGTPTGDCSGFAKSTCDSNTTLALVQSRCLGQKSCSLVASNDVFGDPCSGQAKRLAVKVSCAVPWCASTSSEGASAVLSCGSSQVISRVDFASYGTPTGDCAAAGGGAFSKSACDASSSVSVVQSKCLGLSSCSVAGSNDLFGDPCSGTAKHLAVKVLCAEPVQCAVVAESAVMLLACPANTNKTITKVNFASYGVPQGSCPTFTAGTCHSSTSQSVVEAACLHKSACVLSATNAAFGDPCSGTGKKLAASVTCE